MRNSLIVTLAFLVFSPVAAKKKPAKEVSAWKEERDYSPVRGEHTYYATNWTPTATFAIRCHQGEINVLISPERLIFDPSISYRVDQDEAVLENPQWSASGNNKAIGIWTTQDSVAFLDMLASKKRMIFWYEINHNYGQEKGLFTMPGIEKIVQKVKKECNVQSP